MTYNADRSDFASEISVTYRERLKCWVIVRLLPRMQRVVVDRFHKRADADGHMYFLRQQIPDGTFVVMFDVQIDRVDHDCL
ncbi:hypothetical protein ACKFKG_09160 [Phormidesmis sp. 146-35]